MGGDESDCAYPTTTSEPWLGEQQDEEEDKEYALPYNPYKNNMKKRKSRKRDHHSRRQSVLFGAENALAEQTRVDTVSLSTLLGALVAALAVWQMYRCWTQSGGYEKLADSRMAQRTEGVRSEY